MLADSVLQVSIRANKQVVEELRGDESMCQALLEIMEPEINKIKETVKEETMSKGIRRAVAALRVCGQEDSAIKRAIMEAYNISASEAEKYI